MKLGWKRLLKLADILDVADAEHRAKGEPTYYQGAVSNSCGSPSCALGHYASNNRRRGWSIRPVGSVYFGGEWTSLYGLAVQGEFDINCVEAHSLFSGYGCAGANTAKQAAKFIRAFVKRKQAEAP